MMRGRIVGEVWATRRSDGLVGRKLVLVGAEEGDRLVVAVDTLDAGIGDTVLVSWGSGARNVLRPGPANRAILCDAALSQVVDGSSDGAAGPSGGA